MSNYLKIISLKNVSYDIETNTIYLSHSKNLEYQTTLKIVNKENLNQFSTIYNVQLFLVNSKTGLKYELHSNYGVNNEIINISFVTNFQSNEDSFIDYLEIKITTENEVLYVRKDIEIKTIQKASQLFKYSVGDVSIIDSNLLQNRIKRGFAPWSSARLNDLSNTIKLLEPFHEVFNSSYFKLNEYLKQSYIEDYERPYNYQRVFLTERPSSIHRIEEDINKELKETTCIQSSVSDLSLSPFDNSTEVNLLTLVLDKFYTSSYIDELNNVLPTKLYLKLLTENLDFSSCTLEGYDFQDNFISEIVTIRKDIYTITQKRFRQIVDIHLNDTIEISTYLDCRFHHTIIRNPSIYPPITDKNGLLFHPNIVRKSNNEQSNLLIEINNPLNNNRSEYSFDFNDNTVNSFFVDDTLDIYWTSTEIEFTSLSYSKLAIDLTKNNYNNVTTNANDFIEVSDKNCGIGDWVDINLNLEDWFTSTGEGSCLFQCKNGSDIYYFDQESKALVSERVYVYKDLMEESNLQLSVRVENSNPYIFSIINIKTKEIISSMTHSNEIIKYSTFNIPEGSLMHYDGSLRITNNHTSKDINVDLEGYQFALIFDWEGQSVLNPLIKIEEYLIKNTETNIEPSLYKRLLTDPLKGTQVYLLSKDLFLNSNILSIGSSWDCSYGLFNSPAQATVKIINQDSSINETIILNPLSSFEDASQIEYNIQIEENTIIIGVNEDYDS